MLDFRLPAALANQCRARLWRFAMPRRAPVWRRRSLDRIRSRQFRPIGWKAATARGIDRDTSTDCLQREQGQSPHVFMTERDEPMTPKAFHALFGRIGARAKMPFQIDPHMLRHACGYALVNAGPMTRGRCRHGLSLGRACRHGENSAGRRRAESALLQGGR
jgi:integrase